MSSPPVTRDVYTVTRLNQEVRGLIEAHLPVLWLEGEISNLARPASGHLYFSLKDAASQVRCAMFRAHNRQLGFKPQNGNQVLARGRASLYPGRGEFQLVIDYMEEAGAGALRRAFEELKQRLAAEGLFAAERKQPVPAMPHTIGVVTSPTGAAIRDILSVVRRRWRGAAVIVYPVPVQGAAAAPAICRMLGMAAERAECNVLILARGGGSLEDLQAFNEESVARAIAACPLPVVSGIGHEIDFTIADFVADQRAATPSAAAELVTPDVAAMVVRLQGMVAQLHQRATRALRQRREQVLALERRLRHPRRRLDDAAQRLDGLTLRLRRTAGTGLAQRRTALAALEVRLRAQHPGRVLATRREHHVRLQTALHTGATRQLQTRQARLAALLRALEAVGPGATMARGYSIVRRESDGFIVRSAATLSAGERARLLFIDGEVVARVLGGGDATQGEFDLGE